MADWHAFNNNSETGKSLEGVPTIINYIVTSRFSLICNSFVLKIFNVYLVQTVKRSELG